jgi:hypothetical protein
MRGRVAKDDTTVAANAPPAGQVKAYHRPVTAMSQPFFDARGLCA